MPPKKKQQQRRPKTSPMTKLQDQPKQQEKLQRQPTHEEQLPEQQLQAPVYWDDFVDSVSTLLTCKIALLQQLARIFLGHEAVSETQTASSKQQNIFVAVGHTLISEYIPHYLPQVENNNNNNNNNNSQDNVRPPVRRDRMEDDESSSDDSMNDDAQLSLQERRLCALALAAVMIERCYLPRASNRGLGGTVFLEVGELLPTYDPLLQSLSSSWMFLNRLHPIFHAERFNWAAVAATGATDKAELDFVSDFLLALPSARSVGMDAAAIFAPPAKQMSTSSSNTPGSSDADREWDVVTRNSNNIDSTKTYTLGRILGSGESCRTFGCVDADFYKSQKQEIDRNDCHKSFVVKVYLTKEGTEKERAIYDVIETNLVPGTTRIFRNAEIKADAQNQERMLVVTPRATHFRSTAAGNHRAWHRANVIGADDDMDPLVTAGHVAQLVHALRSLHTAGIIHRDIQYQNLFCDCGDPSRALINDFGRAVRVTEMRLCDFFEGMRRDWKMLEAAFIHPIGKDSSRYMTNGVDAWKEFWRREKE